MPHEIGHIFGGFHQSCDDCTFWTAGFCRPGCDDGEATFQHALHFRTAIWPITNRKHTIIYSGREDNPKRRIQFYSNPDVEFGNTPTGVEDHADNARQIEEAGCTVANFVDDDSDQLFVQIDAPYEACICSNATIVVDIYGGVPGALTYNWFVSTDGFNWGPVISTFSYYIAPIPCHPGTVVYFRVDVTDSNGQIASSFHSIEAVDDEVDGVSCHLERSGNNDVNMLAINLSPVPVHDIANVIIDSPEDTDAEIKIISVDGHVLKQEKIILEKGTNEFELNAHSWSLGFYNVVVVSKLGLYSERLIK